MIGCLSAQEPGSIEERKSRNSEDVENLLEALEENEVEVENVKLVKMKETGRKCQSRILV